MCVQVVIMVIYFGTVFVKETRTALQGVAAGDFSGLTDWAICLIANKGDKSKCVRLGIILGLSENSVLASFFMGAVSHPPSHPVATRLANTPFNSS